ncbi:MAG: phosphoribosyl-AMP cyclohydrolase [Pseudomonadota bacterium]
MTHDCTDETLEFRPRYDSAGLIMAVVSDDATGKPLMAAFMNEASLNLTLDTGEAHFFSRSRHEIWHKGGTSGNVLEVTELRIDCDQDVLWLTAIPKGHGAACHTGRKSCFYRSVHRKDGKIVLKMEDNARLFDPKAVYTK